MAVFRSSSFHKKSSIGKNGWWALMCFPAFLLIFLFSYVPLPGIIIAFKDFSFAKGLFGSEWTGFRNFEFFFQSNDFLLVTRNTILYNLGFMLIGNAVAVIFALMMYEINKKYFLKAYQTIMFFPYFLSWVVVGYMLFSFISPSYGILTSFLRGMGLEYIDFYSDPAYWPFILILAGIWKGTGSGSVIYYASIVGIDKEYFEAAEIDGASKLQAITNITLPFIRPLVILFLILGIGSMFRSDFGLFYILPQNLGLLQDTTGVIDTYVFNMLKAVGDVGMSAAVGLYQSLVGFVLIMLSNWIVRRVEPENAVF